MSLTPEKWDEVWSAHSFPDGNPMNREFVDRILPLVPQGGSVLDVGAGDGRVGLQVARRRPDVTVCMTDTAPQALADLYAGVQTRGLSNAHVRELDALRIDGRTGGYDLAVCSSLLQYFHDRSDHVAICRGLLRATMPGGLVCVGVTNRWNVPHELLKWWQGPRFRCYPEFGMTIFELLAVLTDVEVGDVEVVDAFGVQPEWGIRRLDFVHRALPVLGRLLRPARVVADYLTNEWVSALFGFHVYLVVRRCGS